MAAFGTFETPTDVRCMAAFGDNPDIEQTSHSRDLPMGVTDHALLGAAGRPAPVIREKSQFRAQHDSLSLSPRS